jgi:hypothetical protein
MPDACKTDTRVPAETRISEGGERYVSVSRAAPASCPAGAVKGEDAAVAFVDRSKVGEVGDVTTVPEGVDASKALSL